MSQPWNLVVGHSVSAVIGWSCGLLINDPVIAAGLAVGGAILAMSMLNCVHPPGAATALVLILSSAQFHSMEWSWVVWIVGVNVGLFLVLALLLNNLLPHRRYPMPAPHLRSHSGPFVDLTAEDFAWVPGGPLR